MQISDLITEMTIDKLIQVFKEKGYAFFDGRKSYNLNIIGVRSDSPNANTFDDHMLVVYRDESLEWIIDKYVITTDPGKRYLKRPINIKGAAILIPGQYRSTYQIARHRGKYFALCQKGGPVKVWRDDNKDAILDHDNDVDEGWHGINIHRAHKNLTLESVNGYSAGCQVFAAPADFAYFMAICEVAESIYGNSFTYTLLDEEDLFDPDLV